MDNPFANDDKKKTISVKQQKTEPRNQTNDGRSRLFCCEQCGKVAKTKQALERHAAYHNTDRPFECQTCGQGFKNTDDLGKHLRRLRKDGKMDHACRVCHKHFKSDVLLHKHLDMLGCKKNEDSTIDQETSFLQNRDLIEKEEKECGEKSAGSVEENIRCFCKDCDLEFSSTFFLKNHYKEKHEDRRRQVCLKCGQTLSSKDSLMRHHNIFHQNDYPYQCVDCQQKFKVKESLCRHIKFVHKDGGYKCEICQRIFSQPVNLKKHMAVHSVHKEFACEKCKKEFRWKQSLQKHMLLHSGPDEISRKREKRLNKTFKSNSVEDNSDVKDFETKPLDVDKVSDGNKTAVVQENSSDLNEKVDQKCIDQGYDNKPTAEVIEVDCYTEDFQTLVESFSEDTLDNTDFPNFGHSDPNSVDKSADQPVRLTHSEGDLKRKSFEKPVEDITAPNKRSKRIEITDKPFQSLLPESHVESEHYYASDRPVNEGNKSYNKDKFEDLTMKTVKSKFQQNNQVISADMKSGNSLTEANRKEYCVPVSDDRSVFNNEAKVSGQTVFESSSDCLAEGPRRNPDTSDQVLALDTRTFIPSYTSKVFTPEASSSSTMNSNVSDNDVTSHNASVNSVIRSSSDGNTNCASTELKTNVRLPEKRPSTVQSQSGFGKFSLIKHMLSLQNEEHFDKSLFVNPFYSRPVNMKSLQKMADKHKFNKDENKFNVSVKQNIPFQWLGLSVRKEKKREERVEEMGEKEISENSMNRNSIEQNVRHGFGNRPHAYGGNVRRVENVKLAHETSELASPPSTITNNSDTYNTEILDLSKDIMCHNSGSESRQVSFEPVSVGDAKMCQTSTQPGFVTSSVDSEAINLSTKQSLSSISDTVNHFQQCHTSLSSAKRFNGFQAMKSLVKHSHENRGKEDENFQLQFSSLKSPFDTSVNRVDPVSLFSSNDKFGTSSSDQDNSYNDLLSSTNLQSLCSVTSSSAVQSSLSSSLSSSSSFPDTSRYLTKKTSEMTSSGDICHNQVSRFTALVSVASSIHQSKHQPAHRSIQHTGQYLSRLHVPELGSRVNDNHITCLTSSNQCKISNSRYGMSSGHMYVGNGGMCQNLPTKDLNDVSILDLLQSTDTECVGF